MICHCLASCGLFASTRNMIPADLCMIVAPLLLSHVDTSLIKVNCRGDFQTKKKTPVNG